ncbi:alpha/beta hydrolase family protein [Candidatus Leptofilum sp.]|uniref:alpha/beta hydrolase family protein n=1 Tax=Candidatus Leptofilum sp. TaxID=3241576 RepID=UPI003B5C80E6
MKSVNLPNEPCRSAIAHFTGRPFTSTICPMRFQHLLPLLFLLGVAGCGTAVQSTATPTIQPSPTLNSVETTVPPPVIAVATLPPTNSSTNTPTAVPLPNATPHPIAPYTIDGLRQRSFPGGVIQVGVLLAEEAAFRRYAISYPSDGLTITGILQVPAGDGPFPVIILNHGYYDRPTYFSGAGTWQQAGFLNQRGYLTIAPDYRSWGDSDSGLSLFHTGLVSDVLNLIASLSSLPQADTSRVGLWGHSMGGGIGTKVLTMSDGVKAAVLHAPNSANDADLIARWGAGCLPGQTELVDQCNPAELLPASTPQTLVDAYFAAAASPEMMQQIAPINHLAYVSVPVQIHIGTADGAGLAETPPDWAPRLHEALLTAGKESTLYTYEGQGHFFTGTAWTEMMTRTADFFDTHLFQ